jgi:hypothetical protein
MLKSAANPAQAARATYLLTACLIALALTVSACAPRKSSGTATMGPGKTATGNSKAAGQQAAPIEFADIPVPKGRKINVDKTMVVGTDVWFGQLTYDTNHSAESMFNFYHRELSGYGWRKITAVRAQTSFLTYERQNRIMTIAITPNRLLGSEVTITVSPRESSLPAPAPAPLNVPSNIPAGNPAPAPAPITGAPLAPPPAAR